MFADVALLSDTVVGLQKQLNILQWFWDNVKLNVNIDKAKVMVYKRGGRISKAEKWSYGDTTVFIHITQSLNIYPTMMMGNTQSEKVKEQSFGLPF